MIVKLFVPVVQWTELRTSKPLMGVQFPPGALGQKIKHGAHSLVVKLQFVELVSRVRFSLGTQVSFCQRLLPFAFFKAFCYTLSQVGCISSWLLVISN